MLPMCAEHTHEIPNFSDTQTRIDDLTHWEDIFDYQSADIPKRIKFGALGVVGVAAAAGAALVAVPAIGGAIGSFASGGALSGAAATSHGLAMLGGGSLAAGGLGMAGGTVVVTAGGGAIGGMYGLRVGSNYLKSDDRFEIDCLADGVGSAVVYSTGFLTEDDEKWGDWLDLITASFPGHPIYRVHWGSKNVRRLMAFGADGGADGAALGVAARAGKHAIRAAGKLVRPLGLVTGAAMLINNPWSVAQHNATAAGTTLAAVLRRTNNADGFVLIGHSLGAAVMASAVTALGRDDSETPVVEAHLLGAAYPAAGDSVLLSQGVQNQVWNYHSMNDKVLTRVFRTATLGGRAAGSHGFDEPCEGVVNVDISEQVRGHSEYVKNVQLRR